MCHYLCFFFNDPATTEIYTLSLHDALPIFRMVYNTAHYKLSFLYGLTRLSHSLAVQYNHFIYNAVFGSHNITWRSEEHTSELQSRPHLVCRLLLEKKKDQIRKACARALTKL